MLNKTISIHQSQSMKSRKMHSIRNTIIAFLFMIAIIGFTNLTNVYSQGPVNGSFIGRVTEVTTKAPIPNATVVFKNIDRGFQTAAKSDSNGYFSRTALPPGNYEIEVQADGYNPQKQSQSLYATRSNEVVPVPFELSKVGSPTTTPTQTAPTNSTPNPVGKTGGSSDGDRKISLNPRRGGEFNSFSVLNLPLGGTTLTRTFDELAFLVPGVNPAPQAIGNSVGPGVGGGVGTSGQFSVNGLRSRANNFTVDGSDNNDEDIGVRRQGFFTLVPQPIESIQEFQIITLLAPAQFGRNLGAQVNANSRSGGNRFTGSIFGLFNSDRLNAANYFDNTSGDSTSALTGVQTLTNGTRTVPVFVDGVAKQVNFDAGEKDKTNLFQGGFAFGGRIVRDKVFFFTSAEGQILNADQETNFAVPTVEQRGIFNLGAQGTTASTSAANGGSVTSIFPTSIDGDAIFSLFPFANNPNGIYGRNTYTKALSADARGGILSGKVDWNIFKINGNQQTLTLRYNFTKDRRNLTDVGGALFSAIQPQTRTDNFSGYLNGALTTNTTNEFRVSYGRSRIRFDELPDETGFLSPVSQGRFTNPDESRFLLNARVLFNITRPTCTEGNCTVPNVASYVTTNNVTENYQLGLIGQMIIAGFSPIGVDVNNFPQQRVNKTLQFADNLRWQVNRHGLTFGTDIRFTQLNSDLPRNSRPLVTFNGSYDNSPASQNPTFFAQPSTLAAAGGATGFFQTLVLPGNDSAIKLNYTQLNFFAQDEWRINPKALLSFGLRYEYNTPPKEADNKIENAFSQPLPARVAAFSQFVDGRTKIFETQKNNFAPRVGLAAAITNKTVVRAGFGMYYDQILGAVVSQSRNVFPTFTTLNFGGGLPSPPRTSPSDQATLYLNLFNPFYTTIGGVPIVAGGTLNTLNPQFVSGSAPSNNFLNSIYNNFPVFSGTPFGATLPQKNLDTPYSFQYSVGIEHQIFKNTFLSVAYVGTTGRKLLRFTTPNLGTNYVAEIQEYIADGDQPIVRADVFDPARPIEDIGSISQFETTGRSRYDSLQIGLRGRLSQSFQYQVSYVYGSVKDDVSDVFDLAGAFSLPQNSLTFDGEYAPANFDVRHRFVYSFNYGLPLLNGENKAVKFFFGGWQIAGAGKFNTGQPFTVNSIFDVNQDGNLTDRLDNVSQITFNDSRFQPLGLNCPTIVQCQQNLLAGFGNDGSVGRNSFRAGSVLDLDLSFSKRFKTVENQYLQFRVDVFNFINRANFGVPVRFLEFPSFGQANSTLTPGRRIQFVVRYNF